MIDSVDGTTVYTYDALGQLLTEKVDGTTVNTMTYDRYGNIRTKNGTAYTYGNGAWKDLLTGYGNQTISYDAQGNPTNYLGHTLAWEKGRQLKSFDGNTYTYNANGIRTSKTIGNVRHNYLLDGTHILQETWDGNTLIPLYDNEDTVCGITYNGSAYYFMKNLQGDVIALTNHYGAVQVRYTYDAWGVPTVSFDITSAQIGSINPFRYRGYYYDTELGMYYLQSRYYDPTVGRFINADAPETILRLFTSVGYDLKTYCFNSPINYKDTHGDWAEKYSGFVRTSVGFNVNYNKSFLSKIFCKSYAANVISLYGGWNWRYGCSYKNMGKTRIATELYAHALLYVIGAGLIVSSTATYYLDKIITYLAGKRALRGLSTVRKKLAYIQYTLGYYLFDHSKVINVNNNEKWYRMVVFNFLWSLY